LAQAVDLSSDGLDGGQGVVLGQRDAVVEHEASAAAVGCDVTEGDVDEAAFCIQSQNDSAIQTGTPLRSASYVAAASASSNPSGRQTSSVTAETIRSSSDKRAPLDDEAVDRASLIPIPLSELPRSPFEES
jgi:hypothetical protein